MNETVTNDGVRLVKEGLLTRRRFLRSSAELAAGVLLVACGAVSKAPSRTKVSSSAPSGNESVTLTLLNNNWGQLYNDAMVKIGNAYTKAHPNVQIKWTFSENWNTKLLTQIAGNTPPDADYTNYSYQAEFAAKGEFLALDGYLKDAKLKADDFIGPMYDASTWNGHLYAIPGGADWLVLFWSKDLYKEVGLDPEKPPTTADELIEHSKRILKKDSAGNIVRLGYAPSSDDFIQWAFIFGGSFYDPERRKVTANDPANVQALEWMLDYVKLLDVNKLAAFSQLPDYSSPGNPFATKKSAYLRSGFWTYDALDKYAPNLDYGIAFWPTLKGTPAERKNYLLQGWMYAIPRNSKHPDEAWRFLKFAFVDRAAQMGYETLNGPCYKPQLPAFEKGLKKQIGTDNRMSPYLDVFTQTAQAGTKYWPVMKVNSYYYNQITDMYDFVTRGKKQPKDALDEVTKNVQARLDNS